MDSGNPSRWQAFSLRSSYRGAADARRRAIEPPEGCRLPVPIHSTLQVHSMPKVRAMDRLKKARSIRRTRRAHSMDEPVLSVSVVERDLRAAADPRAEPDRSGE